MRGRLFRRTTSHNQDDHPLAPTSSSPPLSPTRPKLSILTSAATSFNRARGKKSMDQHSEPPTPPTSGSTIPPPITVGKRKSLVDSLLEEDEHQVVPSIINTSSSGVKERVNSTRKIVFQLPPQDTSSASPMQMMMKKNPTQHKKTSSLDFEEVNIEDDMTSSDEDDDEISLPVMKKSFRPFAKKSTVSNYSSDEEEEEEERDVVSKKKKDVRGMLAIRKTVGGSMDGSSSDDEDNSNASDLDSNHGLVEDLFDETLEEIQQQEANELLMQSKQISAAPLDFTEVLKMVPFFAQFSSEHQAQLFSELQEETFRDGDSIVQQGDLGDKFYTIVDGEAVVSKRNKETNEEKDLTHIYPGDFFGEMVLIYGGERVASVTSVGNTKCMTLSRKSFEKYPIIRYFLILQKVPLLSACSRKVQLEIVSRLTPVVFNKGDYVVKQGEIGEAFFMITKGSAAVIEDESRVVTNLYEGHSFGEMSLLSDEPRVASIKATTELHLMLLSVKDFKELLTGEEDFSQLLEQESKKIRDLRDKRGGMKAVASRSSLPEEQLMIPPPAAAAAQQQSTAKMPSKQASSLLQISQPTLSQQKIRVGKTAQGRRTVNQYAILDEIGRGAFGVVKLCENQDNGQTYAVKIIDKTLFKNKIASKHQITMEDVRREAAIMKDLHHPNIVELVDVLDDPKLDQLYLVQELCAKGAIMENLDGCVPLDEITARKYFRDLLCGIDYLHASLIVHRDIKPMNLFLTEEDIVKIGDFGSARVFKQEGQDGTGPTMLNIAGTPAFMAPELLGQESSLYDGPLVDLWSCGATLFMLVTGVPPWMADDEPTLAKRVQNDELVFPSTGKKLSPHLKNLLTRLLVKDPKGRMDLNQTVSHEWVTEEGSEPLERYVRCAAVAAVASDTHSMIELVTPMGTPVSSARKQPPSSLSAVAERASITSNARKLSLANFSLFGSSRPSSMQVMVPEEDSSNTGSPVMSQPLSGGRERGESTTDFSLFDVGKSASGLGTADRPLSMFFGRASHSSKKKNNLQGLRNPLNRLSLATGPMSTSLQQFPGLVGMSTSSNAGSRRQSSAKQSENEEEEEAGGEEELSLSAILNDPTIFKLMQRNKEHDNDKTLLALQGKKQQLLVKATRGYAVAHCSIRYGFAEAQGVRPTMEDCVAIVPRLPGPDTFFAAVFDGHGGDLVSKELKAKFHKVLGALPEFTSEFSQQTATMMAAFNTSSQVESSTSTRQFPNTSSLSNTSSLETLVQQPAPATSSSALGDSLALPSALRKTCLLLDKNIMHSFATKLLDMESKIEKGDEKKGLFRTKGGGKQLEGGGSADLFRKTGSTAVVALVRGGSNPKKQPGVLTVAWVGDSRAVLCRAGKPVEVSKDHKAEREDEKQRIRANGGTVDRQGRLYGDLAVSRAFGDLQHKGRELRTIVNTTDENEGAEGTLIALPDVTQIVLTAQDEFLVLASDGVFDVMSNEQVCNYVRFHLNRHGDVRKAALELVDKALEMHSVDNVSAVIIGFVGKY